MLFPKPRASSRPRETAGREMTAAESNDVSMCITAANALTPQIKAIESRNTMGNILKGGMLIPGVGASSAADPSKKTLTPEYRKAFQEWALSGGQTTSASLYEGAGSQGGYAVPITVAGQICSIGPA